MIVLLYKIYVKTKDIILTELYKNRKWVNCEDFIVTGTSNISEKERINVKNNVRSKEFLLNNKCNPGSRVHFKTNAEKIQIRIKLSQAVYLPHMSLNATSGVDLYEWIDGKKIWKGCFSPKNIFSTSIVIETKPESENSKFEMLLPSFANVLDVKIRACNGVIKKSEYPYEMKIGVYGSSISQGCASSRPGLSYTNQLADMLNAELFNYGFSGSAHGELEIAEQIGKMDLNAIVMEYDHNADVDELEKTHKPFFDKLREYTDIPIIMISRLSGGISNTCDEQEKRNAIIRNTYIKAVKSGDTRVHFICGDDLISEDAKERYFVDDRHPNDRGMHLIAAIVCEKIREAVLNG